MAATPVAFRPRDIKFLLFWFSACHPVVAQPSYGSVCLDCSLREGKRKKKKSSSQPQKIIHFFPERKKRRGHSVRNRQLKNRWWMIIIQRKTMAHIPVPFFTHGHFATKKGYSCCWKRNWILKGFVEVRVEEKNHWPSREGATTLKKLSPLSIMPHFFLFPLFNFSSTTQRKPKISTLCHLHLVFK